MICSDRQSDASDNIYYYKILLKKSSNDKPFLLVHHASFNYYSAGGSLANIVASIRPYLNDFPPAE